jgi:RimJ/RimL family protein N-acetyltransferase
MLTIDREGEAFVFENNWDLLIPFSMEKMADGELAVSAIPRVARIVREFLGRYSDEPFSDRALAWLWERIEPFEAEWGYRGGRYRWRRCRIFRLPEQTALPLPLPGTRELVPSDAARNKTTYSIIDSLEAGAYMAGVLDGGFVVSVAVTHDSIAEAEPGDVLELGVETVPSARGRGYAASCLSLAASELLSRGLIPEYRSVRSNRASARVAERVGFRQVGEACYLLMRRDPTCLKHGKGAVSDGV